MERGSVHLPMVLRQWTGEVVVSYEGPTTLANVLIAVYGTWASYVHIGIQNHPSPSVQICLPTYPYRHRKSILLHAIRKLIPLPSF
jgi:hypothetical protein